MGVKDPRCWTWTPPECPVRVPLLLTVAGRPVEVEIGTVEGAEGCARVVVGGRTFGEGAECDSFVDAAQIAVQQLEARIRTDLAVGAIVRGLLKRKPWIAKIAEVVIEVMLREMEGDERDVMKGALGEFTNPPR